MSASSSDHDSCLMCNDVILPGFRNTIDTPIQNTGDMEIRNVKSVTIKLVSYTSMEI